MTWLKKLLLPEIFRHRMEHHLYNGFFGKEMDKKGIPNQNDLVEGYGHDGDFWSLGHYNFLQKIYL